jgi:glycerol-3-phosphate acyltransferase PlsX
VPAEDTRLRIAVDAMGGDRAPVEPIRAAARISRETTLDLLLVGKREVIAAELDRVDHRPAQLEVVDAREVITMEEKPRAALAAKPDASLAVAMRAVAAGDADALVCAGSTGAIVLAAAELLPRIPGIDRAALAAVYPTRKRQSSDDPFALMLDVGATVRVRSHDLVHFAYMGHAYARAISKVGRPTIGLLNMGSEPTKGDAVLREAYAWMDEDPTLNFVGNLEGNDIPTGGADVIVCEGYVGNVALKMAEGVSEVFKGLGEQAFKQSLLWRLGLLLLAGGLRRLKHVTDYREYGGAPLLGFRAPVIKAHGRSGEVAIANAIKVAAKAARDGVCAEIERAVAGFRARRDGADGGASTG